MAHDLAAYKGRLPKRSRELLEKCEELYAIQKAKGRPPKEFALYKADWNALNEALLKETGGAVRLTECQFYGVRVVPS